MDHINFFFVPAFDPTVVKQRWLLRNKARLRVVTLTGSLRFRYRQI